MTEHPYDGAGGRPLLDLVIKGMSVVDSDGSEEREGWNTHESNLGKSLGAFSRGG